LQKGCKPSFAIPPEKVTAWASAIPTPQTPPKRTEDGTEENIFSLLDEDSDLLELAPGDNLLKATADSGETSLQVTVRFYPMVSGILPEVIS